MPCRSATPRWKPSSEGSGSGSVGGVHSGASVSWADIVVGLLVIAGAGPKVGGAGLVLRGPHPSPILACPRSAVPSGPHTITVAGCAAGTRPGAGADWGHADHERTDRVRTVS
ncbi:hypothetical protein GCM10027055_29640 [Janibacter alkaliphilus]